MNVALHELLGHGSGKMLSEYLEGETLKLNFDPNTTINPLTNEPVKTWYKIGDNWNFVFTTIASAWEECRAESSALLLSCFPESYAPFEMTDLD